MLCIAMIEDADRRNWLIRRSRQQGLVMIGAESPVALADLLGRLAPDALLLSVEQHQEAMLHLADAVRAQDPHVQIGFVAGFALVPMQGDDALGQSHHLREAAGWLNARHAA